jgi:21S rRNA (uridine2791-2'-O)-methyltransferase
VQEEVKKFLLDTDRGRPRQPVLSSQEASESTDIVDQERRYIDLERHADEAPVEGELKEKKARRGSKKGKEDSGKMVDVVLSDMSAPWEQTTGFWKRSLSDPYIRMMNTSGINFKDHVGSMVSLTLPPPLSLSPRYLVFGRFC